MSPFYCQERPPSPLTFSSADDEDMRGHGLGMTLDLNRNSRLDRGEMDLSLARLPPLSYWWSPLRQCLFPVVQRNISNCLPSHLAQTKINIVTLYRVKCHLVCPTIDHQSTKEAANRGPINCKDSSRRDTRQDRRTAEPDRVSH